MATSLAVVVVVAACDEERTVLDPVKHVEVAFNLVADEAPDHIPAGFFNSGNYVTYAGLNDFRVKERMLVIQFVSSASQAARQAVVDSLRGTVVGGSGGGPGGLYLVQLPDSVPNGSMFAIAGDVRGWPNVQKADPDLLMIDAVTYRRPTDGTGWQASNWKLGPDSVYSEATTRQNWALEAINAPLAWGCSVGDTATRVAMLDVGFYRYQDLVSNLESGSDTALTGSINHAAAMMAVMAARGNNDSGMTGVMWRARVKGYDVSDTGTDTVSPLKVAMAIQHAASNGIRIVNMSIGKRGTPSTPTAADSAARQTWMGWVETAILNGRMARGDSGQFDPLLVIGAGNINGADPWHAAFALAGDVFPDRVLVVGGSTRTKGQMLAMSGAGPRVDIVAPGEDVSHLTSTGSITDDDGVSLSTAIVSGVAGLVLSFDPRLTVTELRQLILDGAAAGRDSVAYSGNLHFVADAYESLKLAAQRSGAPLCGQRAWVNGLSVYAERGNSAVALGSFPDQGFQLGYLNVFHGGKRIELNYGGVALEWSNGSWGVTTNGPGEQVEGGSFQSPAYSYNHDQSLWAGVPVVRRSTADVVTMDLYDVSGLLKTFEKSFAATRAPSSGIGGYTAVYTCCPSQFSHFEPAGTAYWGEWDEIASNWGIAAWPYDSTGGLSATIAPQGNFALVAIPFVHHRWTDGGFYDCGWETPVPSKCRALSAHDSVTRTEVWRVDLTKASGDSTAWTQVHAGGQGVLNRNNAMIVWGSISEDGHQYMWDAVGPVYQSGDALSAVGRVITCGSTGTLEWTEANPASGALGAVRRSVNVSGTDICNGYFWGGATMSSTRAPSLHLKPPPKKP